MLRLRFQPRNLGFLYKKSVRKSALFKNFSMPYNLSTYLKMLEHLLSLTKHEKVLDLIKTNSGLFFRKEILTPLPMTLTLFRSEEEKPTKKWIAFK